MSHLPQLLLKRGDERRLRIGHTWVFSNEINTAQSPLKDFEPGQPVAISDFRGHILGNGYVNPHALICARLVTRHPERQLNASLITHRIQVALSLRTRLYATPHYRLIYGDSDGLPGLVLDRYGDVFVGQITTVGMERHKEEITAVIAKLFNPKALVWRNDGNARELEQLPSYTETAIGTPPDATFVEEGSSRFQINVERGQKTGWFYDHRDNRQRLSAFVTGKKVLDVFSYVGAWGIQAAGWGAESVTCIDASQDAIEQIRHNAALNQVAEQVTAVQGNAFNLLKELREERQRFDVIVVDPPAFIQRKKDLKSGLEAYRRINQQAIQLLAKDGMLVSSSCSSHLEHDVLQHLILKAGRHLDRQLQIVAQGHQASDHPVHPAIAETSYLKALFCRVLPTF